MAQTYRCEYALLPEGIVAGVRITVGAHGRIGALRPVTGSLEAGEVELRGMVLPGFANAHSHAFHRALRGRTHHEGGTFWTWRQGMYTLAGRLDPDSYYRLARAVYAEMILAGYTAVGEFHYLHHPAGGGRYADPNAMGAALRAAAREAGIRLTLLDTCYLAGGIGVEPQGVQRRFTDGSATAWAERFAAHTEDARYRIGGAVHSVRAVPEDALAVIEAAVPAGRPVHAHLSEQPAENAQCLAAYGRTPAQVLAEHGVLSARSTMVHATHLTEHDIGLIGAAGADACFCPSTEADLADGIGPARELLDAGATLSLGSDQHAVLDPLAELQGLERGERLRSGRRGRLCPAELVAAATAAGQAATGWADSGVLEVGRLADFVALRRDSPRTAGSRLDELVYCASAADVHTVVVGGAPQVREGRHLGVDDPGALLATEIERLWE
ncbi:MAG: formimidoylglutamate deiminase [Sciscionella sp.]